MFYKKNVLESTVELSFCVLFILLLILDAKKLI